MSLKAKGSNQFCYFLSSLLSYRSIILSRLLILNHRLNVSGKALSFAATAGLLSAVPSCTHSVSSDSKESPHSLVLKSGDQGAVMNGGVSEGEWLKRATSSEVSRDRIEAELVTGKSEKSEESARNLLLKNPASKEGLEALATSLYLQGRHEKAAYYARLLLEKYPSNTVALNVSGLSLMKRGNDPQDLRQAKTFFESAFSSDTQEIAAGLNLGHLLLETGNSKRSLSIFEQTASRCNDCLQAILGASIAARRAKDFKTSKEYLDQATASKSPVAYYHLALWHMQSSNDLASAREALGKVRMYAQNPSSLIRQKADSFFKQVVVDMEKKGAVNE